MVSLKRLIPVVAWGIAVVLALTAPFFYPLSEANIQEKVLYEVVVLLGVTAISLLIYKKGFPDT